MSCQSQPTGGRRRSRKMRGGNGYGVGSPISVGALEYVPNMTSVPNGAPYKPTGGRRRRRSRRRGGAADLDDVPVVGDIVADDGSKLFPEQQCVSEGRTWTAAPYGYTLTDAGNGLLGIGPEIADPKNANGDPLGHCSGTSPPPNMGPTAPRAEEGGRRRRRRGGADPDPNTTYATAPLDPDMVTKSQCPEPYVFVKSIRNDAGVMMGYCRAEGDWQITTKLNKHKGGRRTRRKHRGRRRSMRGGGSVAGVGYGFTGSGERGMANQSPYPSNLPPSGAFAIPTGTR